MLTVGDNVFSLLGFPIVGVPEYRAVNGKKMTFQALVASDDGGFHIDVCGTRTAFGLVIHRIVTRDGLRPGWLKWTISEPTTGRAVAWGCTKQDALEDLALRVAFWGGEEAFEKRLQDAILNNFRFGKKVA